MAAKKQSKTKHVRKAHHAKPQAKGAAHKPAPKKIGAKPVVKSGGVKAVEKSPKVSENKTSKPEKPSKVSVKPAKSAGAKSSAGKGKKQKGREAEFEDDLLLSDDDVGSEELPDLSEFDETEAEAEVSDDSSDSDSLLVESEVRPPNSDDEVILTDAEGRRLCRVKDCDQAAAVEGYCRYHYLSLWKRIQVRRKILADGKLTRYVEELTSRYPDKFLEMIWKDLKTEKDFMAAIAELEIDESGLEAEFEEDQSYIDEVRGVSNESASMAEEEEF